MRPAFSVRGFCVIWSCFMPGILVLLSLSFGSEEEGNTWSRADLPQMFLVASLLSLDLSPSSTGTTDRAPQNFQPCLLLCHAQPLVFFFFLKKKQLHLSLSLARKSHALQCRYKVWVPALKAYISLYSLAPGGRLREEGQGMGSGRSFQLSGFAFLKPVLDKSVYYYLLLLHRLSLFQKGWERLQRGHKLRFPAILFSPCFSSFSG